MMSTNRRVELDGGARGGGFSGVGPQGALV